jgi:hypothetical protein
LNCARDLPHNMHSHDTDDAHTARPADTAESVDAAPKTTIDANTARWGAKIADLEAKIKELTRTHTLLTNKIYTCLSYAARLAMNCVRGVQCSCSVFSVRNM